MNTTQLNTRQKDDKEYYPRLKRAPYIYDGSDFVSRPIRPHLGSEMDVPLNDEGDNPSSLTRTPYKSSSNLNHPSTMKRRGSLLRVFSSLGMSPTRVAEGAVLDSQDGGETNPLLLLPRTRRGSSVDVAKERERMNSRDSNAHKYPQWALHDPASIVMKNGFPVTVGTLIQHHLLLEKTPQQLSPHCIVTPTWRLKERMKTVGVALVLALNIGTDPPGLIKPSPCAKLQCWLDPTSVSRAKAKERIGERLEQQYAKWQQRSKLKYRRAIDPTVDVVKELCLRMRESAKHERVLFHYNGHGVPRPTNNGEIWLFDRHHTNYIPLSVTDLRRWIGKPSIVVLDCSGAGQLMPYFSSPIDGDFSPTSFHRGSLATMDNSDPSDPSEQEYQAIRDTIVLCPTSQGEWLPLNPELPADVFTSCLTTPIPIALRWFVYQNPLSMEKIDLETIADSIPGKLTDRKTPLGELNWIFTAVTDTIAWNVLPSALFQRLFRQDLLVASMFRNFLLAERILKSLKCTPMSNPEIPSTCNHPLWDAWDLAVETCLHQLIDQGYLRKSAPAPAPTSPEEEGDDASNNQTAHEPQHVTIAAPPADSPFFGEQLTAFEIWLEYASTKPKSKLVIRSPPSSGTPLPYLWSTNPNPHELDPPVELPIVLQVLLSQAHRVRALVLLKRFLDLGPSAVNLALSVGIFPYVLKLLQSPIDEYKHVLISIWSRIISFDETCQVDVVKDRALSHFIRHLNWGLTPSPSNKAPVDALGSDTRSEEDAHDQRTMAAFIMANICCNYTLGQSESINEKLHLVCASLLQLLESEVENENSDAGINLSPSFRTWICICLGNLAKDNTAAQSAMVASGIHHHLVARLNDRTPDVRAAACYALACVVGSASLQQPPCPPQELSPTIQSMMVSASTFNAPPLPPNKLAPSYGNISQPNYGSLGLQPIPLTSSQQGLNYLVPSNEQSTLFGGSMTETAPAPPEIRTVFDDQHRMSADIHAATELSNVLNDASPVVRFEAIIALNHVIVKYLDAFVSVAAEKIGSSQRSIMGGMAPSIPVPSGMSSDAAKSFSLIWTQLLKHYRCEPQPSVQSLLSSIVVSVNERVVSVQSALRQRNGPKGRQSLSRPITEEHNTAESGDDAVPLSEPHRSATGLNLSSYMYGSPQNPIKRSGSIGMTIGTPPHGLLDNNTVADGKKHPNSSLKLDLAVEGHFCAESLFYQWKKVEFADRSVNIGARQRQDLLSDIGAIQCYRSKRNSLVQRKAQLLKDSFAVLAEPKETPDSPYVTDVHSALDKDIDMRKEATHLKQSLVLNNASRGGTSLLRFHPYEPALVVCGGSDISCWNATTAEKMSAFSNDNPKNTRMTAASWINETTTSLFLSGCSDGSVRIWDGLFEPNDEMSRDPPTLISSFFAAPNMSSEKGSTGLILEYQSYGGQLIAGGSTRFLYCWDIESEKCRNSFDVGGEAMLTTLESTWKHDYRDGYYGFGADVVIAGFSNGGLKVFDTRVKNGAPAINVSGKKRIKQAEFHEHSSWIVDVSFTGFGGRYEVISGDVSGNIKFWDLRYSSSTRTLNHKMLMTALAVHANIPMLATGSPAQFIKMVSYDGTTQQVIRYHEQIQGQRLGPVSCLSFHDHMPYLAAGFSDDVVSIYSPKDLG